MGTLYQSMIQSGKVKTFQEEISSLKIIQPFA
jgi:hypothetical protein